MSKILLKQKILFFILTFFVFNLFFGGAYYFYFNVISQTIVLSIVALHFFWLIAIAHNLGFEVFLPGGDWYPDPNLLGWLLVVIGGLVTFAVYYFVSVKIARWWNRRNLESDFNMELKKVHKIFIGLILIEIILIALTFLYGNSCAPCDNPYSIFNPFGIEDQTTNESKACPLMCFWSPHDFFYLIFDVFFLTIVIYILTIIIKKSKHKKKYQKLKNK